MLDSLKSWVGVEVWCTELWWLVSALPISESTGSTTTSCTPSLLEFLQIYPMPSPAARTPLNAMPGYFHTHERVHAHRAAGRTTH